MWWTIIGAIILYFVGFLLGRKYEKDSILEDVYGVLSQINKNDMTVDSVTYYYTKEAYDAEVKRIKELGEEYYE